MQTVYVDLLFLINFSMDLLCFFLVSKLLCRKLSLPRAILGAAIGGGYSVAALFLPLYKAEQILANALCCIIMCAVACFKKGDRAGGLIKLIVTYLLSSMLLGGIMTATFNFLNSANVDFELGESNDIPPWLMISVGISSMLATFAGGRFLKRRADRQSARVNVTLCGNEVSFEAMYDSGNLLRDSVSGRPVIVADARHAKTLLGTERAPSCDILDELKTEIAKRAVVIPYHTASGCKTMIAVRPQKLTVTSCGRTVEVDALIGFADVKNTIDGCSALVPYELI